MKITILGTAQSGQQQLFSVLTGLPLDGIQQKAMEVQLGICPVKDPRVDRLVELYKPKKISYARIEYALLPDFNLQTGPSKEKMMTELKNADEFCWVARIENAESDIRSFLSELIIADMMLLEKRLETIEKSQKKKYSEQIEKEKTLLLTCKKQIEEDVYDIMGIIEPEQPVILDIENIRVVKPGQYEISLIDIFKKKPVVYRVGEGKYIIDLVSTFKNLKNN